MRSHLIPLILLVTNSSSSIDDAIRQSLEATSEKWFHWILFSTAVVAFGCILEIGETASDLKRWIRLKRKLPVTEEDLTSWHVPLGAIGLFLVIVGVCCEGVFEEYASISDNALRSHMSEQLEEAEQQAGDAKQSALDAQGAAARARADADAAGLRVTALSKEAAQIGMRLYRTQDSLVWQGPRVTTISADLSPFKDHLTQFAGQSFITTLCWGQFISRGDQEIHSTEVAVQNALVASGWKLDSLSISLEMDRSCGTIGEGVIVFVRDDASQRTKDAARMLCAVLDEVLKQVIPVIPIDGRGRAIMGLTQIKPDTIVVRASMHPMQRTGPGIDDIKLLESDPHRDQKPDSSN